MEIKENTQKPNPRHACCSIIIIGVFLFSCIMNGVFLFSGKNIESKSEKIYVPDITIAFMNFTMFKTSETRFSATWNLTIRVPEKLPGLYICLHGDFQASLLYKDITIATTSSQRYKHLQPGWSHLLGISGVVSEEDISGAIGKSIMDDIKERSEVRFGLRLFFTDCRVNTTGLMKYACDEAKLRYDSRSQEITTTMFGNPTCHYDDH